MEQDTVLNATEQVVGQIMPLELGKIVLIPAVYVEDLEHVLNAVDQDDYKCTTKILFTFAQLFGMHKH